MECLARHFEEAKDKRAEHRERDRAEQDDKGIPEAIELGGEHQEDEHQGEEQRGQEFASFDAELTRFAGIIELVALRQNFGGLSFKEFQGFVERPYGYAADFDSVELLKPVKGAGAGFFLQVSEGA
jgi:hypothetical protein